MRAYKLGVNFRVVYTEKDAQAFADRWPCSGVKGSGYFTFAPNGDLVGCGTDNNINETAWSVFADDCKALAFPASADDGDWPETPDPEQSMNPTPRPKGGRP